MVKILIFNVNWLGDILLSFPALYALKKHYPNHHLASIVPPAFKNLFENQPCVDKVIAFPDRTIFEKYRLIKYLRKEKWDMGILFHPSRTRRSIFKWSKIPIHMQPTSIQGQHKMDRFKYILNQQSISDISSHYEYHVISKVVSIPKPYIVFHPGANWKPKQWPVNHFSALGEMLQKKWNIPLVITGSLNDIQLAQKIRQRLKNHIFDLTGKTSFPELANIFSQSALVIAGDTGAMHLASAVKAPLLALYGPTSPVFNGPRGKGDFKIIWKDPSLENLSPKQVFSTISDWNIL